MTRPSRGAASALVREALELRGWAIALLAGNPAGASPGDAARTGDDAAPRDAARAGTRDVPHVTAAAWRLFLRAECCALELAARVDAAGVALPAEAGAILASARHASLARVLTARTQVARIDAMLDRGEPGTAPPALLLKGGVAAVLGDTPSDLSDVDILPGAGGFDVMVEGLLAQGYTHVLDSPLHLKLSAPGALAVEVHHSLNGARPASAASDATVPIPGLRRLHRMANVPYLVFAIEHAVVAHPHRRGHLRDACLIAGAATRCTAGELREVRAALRGAHGGAACEAMLDFSLALRGGDAPVPAGDRDPFRMVAAMKYALVAGHAGKATTEFAARLAMGPDIAGEFVGRYLGTVRRGTRLHPEWLARRVPRFATAFELLARLPVRLARVGRGAVRAACLRREYGAPRLHARGAAPP